MSREIENVECGTYIEVIQLEEAPETATVRIELRRAGVGKSMGWRTLIWR